MNSDPRTGIAALLACLLVGCSPRPNMTVEGRRGDIEFLARWARDYGPFVELNEKLRDGWIQRIMREP